MTCLLVACEPVHNNNQISDVVCNIEFDGLRCRFHLLRAKPSRHRGELVAAPVGERAAHGVKKQKGGRAQFDRLLDALLGVVCAHSERQ